MGVPPCYGGKVSLQQLGPNYEPCVIGSNESRVYRFYFILLFTSAREVLFLLALSVCCKRTQKVMTDAVEGGHILLWNLFTAAAVKLFPVFKRAPYWPGAPAVACHAS